MKKNMIIFFCFWIAFISSAWCENNEFDKRMLKDITIMESRHFKNKSDPNDSNEYRLSRLETELMGKTFDNETIEVRMKRLKIASQKRALAGTAMPSSIRMSSTKFNNDSIQVVEKNEGVGIFDGLMRLYAPQAYEIYKKRSESLLKYERSPD